MLSSPAPRSHLHTREIIFQGYAREDGLWDIEAHLRDFKSNPFTTGASTWQPGEAFHDMWVRVTLNTQLVIQDIEVVMDKHPHPECPQVIPPMDALIGEQIGKGWRKTINTHLGGIQGCTHLRELLASMATAAFQSIPGALLDSGDDKPPLYLGTCKSWDFDGPVVLRHYPKFYQWKG
ncbi:hypothetical protein TUM22923_03370 [Polynucleobacter sp. TUM22923]|jgi:hypothetical protein|uniref:DUF2889 domain-containing protein n=1 Tax=Polynucleobacter sp. TUM22923 TaxID=3022126 RepID=UPI0025738E6E|nr:DUF2889 domain-containing protein [Polynucleobacter sp. TUM22923]BDX21016.1 hypothetical protein TUM22923_03370 [Polynucleobacter sp. TUM22923]